MAWSNSAQYRMMTEGADATRLPFEFDRDFESATLYRKSYYRIALLVPLCGSAGLWSPSCIASAQLAVEELNRDGGIDGRQVQLVMIDSALEAPTPVEEIVNDLIETKAIDAIVGMHISAIRQRLSKIVCQRIPYIYTPLYEGGETTPGIVAIGETPGVQLGPAIDFLQNKYRIKNWALIGQGNRVKNELTAKTPDFLFLRARITDLGSMPALEMHPLRVIFDCFHCKHRNIAPEIRSPDYPD